MARLYNLPNPRRTFCLHSPAMGKFFRKTSTRYSIFSSSSSFIVLDSSSFSSEVDKNELIEFYSTLLGKLVFTWKVLDPKFH